MAAKKEKKFDDTKLKKDLSDFMFVTPERDEEGAIITPKYDTGIFALNRLLKGGFPIGRVLGLGAEPGVGKTTLLIQAVGNIVRRTGKKAYYIDVEGGATYELWESMGYADLLYHPDLNPEGTVFLVNMETIQDIARLTKQVTQDPDTALIVYDSDTMVVDRADLEDEELGSAKSPVGANARMWSKNARPIAAVVKKSNACLIIVHQARVDLSGFIPKVVSAGGNAAKHIASVEIWGRTKKLIGEGNVTEGVKKEEAIGCVVELSTAKNRMGLPFRKFSVPVFFGKGVSNLWFYKEWLEETSFVVDTETGEIQDHIVRAGSWYTVKVPGIIDEKVQGDNAVWQLIIQNKKAIKEYVENSIT